MAMRQTFTFEPGDPERLDAFLQLKTDLHSRAIVQKHIRAKHVHVNGQTETKTGFALYEDDKIEIDRITLPSSGEEILSEDMKLHILYEDDACIVIDKPRGITVHPAASVSDSTILNGALKLFEDRKLPFNQSSVLVHRLDKDTTGALLLAKNAEIHTFLQKQFENRSVDKKYLALVAGMPKEVKAMIDAPIGRHATVRTKMSSLHMGRSRDARTSYEVVAANKGVALLECTLHTGRTHQIRVHLETIGHPVLGDKTYGSATGKDLCKEHDINFLCLHAWKLTFDSPATKKSVTVEAPVPADFKALLHRLSLGEY